MSTSPRPTGTSLAAILLAALCVAAVAALHLLRADLDPVGQVMSEYANGPFGVVMTIAFYALALACLALGWRLRSAVSGSAAAVVLPWLLALAGTGLLLAGVFEVERPDVADTVAEAIHSLSSVAAFVLLVVAMGALAAACRRDPAWRSFTPTAAALAAAGVVAAAASPLADLTPFAGVVQRLLGLVVVAWLLLVALRIRRNAVPPPTTPTLPAR